MLEGLGRSCKRAGRETTHRTMVRLALAATFVLVLPLPLAAQTVPMDEPASGPREEPVSEGAEASEALVEAPANPETAPPDTETSETATPETSETEDPLLLPEVVDEAEEEEEGSALASPRIDAAGSARALRNLDFASRALAHERGSADLEFAVAVNLYVGGVLLSVLSASLIIGTVFEAACINGDISECTDGPAFLIGAIPATIAAVALLFGGATTEARAQAHYRSLDRREREVEDRRRLLPSASLSIGPASIAVQGRF